jgi:hypothetical protein
MVDKAPMKLITRLEVVVLAFVAAVALILPALAAEEKANPAKADAWTETLLCPDEDFTNTGCNAYFILEPGYQLFLAGKEDGKKTELVITVLDETQEINGVATRVVGERETADGKLVEVSRNFFVIGVSTRNLYYFGADVDVYKGDQVVHEGAWRAGKDGAKHGMLIPGAIKTGDRCYQEKAPGVALDRAENVSVKETVKTSAGTFKNCLKTRETMPLESGTAYQHYAPDVGLIEDSELKLVKYGFLKK